MALKKLLGLEGIPLSETEIMCKIQQAYLTNKKVVEFYSKGGKVTVKLAECSPYGVISWHEDWGGG